MRQATAQLGITHRALLTVSDMITALKHILEMQDFM